MYLCWLCQRVLCFLGDTAKVASVHDNGYCNRRYNSKNNASQLGADIKLQVEKRYAPFIHHFRNKRETSPRRFKKTSWTTTGDGEKHWPIADQRIHSNNPKNNCEAHFDSIPFLVSKAANKLTLVMLLLGTLRSNNSDFHENAAEK